MADYKVIRSGRKTLGLQIRESGELIVRAPYRVSDEQIRKFVDDHAGWIAKHLQMMNEKQKTAAGVSKLTWQEMQELADRALQVIPERVGYYAAKMGVTYGRITIRNQKTRWGSCSSRGNLNFNCLLMLTPPEVIDSVVVHELCHLKEMNHSKRFYEEVLKVYPDYYKWHGWLKEHREEIMGRMI